MELEDDVWGERDVGRGFVNQIEGVAVPGDLLLGPVARGRGLEHERLDPLPRRGHTFETVRRLRRFDHGGFAQSGQNLWSLLAEQVLTPTELAQGAQLRPMLRREARLV